jgi:hypothetical protein
MISQPLPFMDGERSRAAARVGNVSRAPQPESERKISRASSFPLSGVKLNVAASSSRSHKVESVINNPLQQDTHEAAEQRQDDHAQDPDQVQPGARSTGDQELPGAAYSGAGNQLEDEEARIVDAAGATENDNMDHVSKAGQGTTSREEDFSCTADQEHAAACRSVESSDDTGNKRKIEIQYSDAGKETNTGYFTDSKVDPSLQEPIFWDRHCREHSWALFSWICFENVAAAAGSWWKWWGFKTEAVQAPGWGI